VVKLYGRSCPSHIADVAFTVAIGDLTPNEFVARSQEMRAVQVVAVSVENCLAMRPTSQLGDFELLRTRRSPVDITVRSPEIATEQYIDVALVTPRPSVGLRATSAAR
jgi:hypothetical protein